MATRLNKDMIADIIAKAIKATTIEKEIDQVKSDLRTRVYDHVKANTPPALLNLVKQYPREWFIWATFVNTSNRDDECRANPLWHFKSATHSCYNPNIDFEPLPSATGLTYFSMSSSVYEDLGERAAEIIARRDELQQSLRAYLSSHRTVEAALKDMPELEPFMPKGTAPTGALVAANNVAVLLAKSGYPPGNS